MINLRISQTAPYEIDVTFWRRNAFGFLLKSVQHIDGFFETHCVNGPISIAIVILDEFQNAASKTFERLCRRRMLPCLCQEQLKAQIVLHLSRKLAVAPFAGCHPEQWPYLR